MPKARLTCHLPGCDTTFIRYWSPGTPTPKYCTAAHSSQAQRSGKPPRKAFANVQRRSSARRGYGEDHKRERERRLELMHDGDACCRCARPMYHTQPIHLDHNATRTGYLGLAHARCNIVAGARAGAKASQSTTGTKRCATCGRAFRPWTPGQTKCSHACRRPTC
jgi:hypothetical protein